MKWLSLRVLQDVDDIEDAGPVVSEFNICASFLTGCVLTIALDLVLTESVSVDWGAGEFDPMVRSGRISHFDFI